MQQIDYIRRHLVRDERVVEEDEILNDSRHVIVLAEPGAGKTELLDSFSRALGVKRHRASIFRSQANPTRGQTLIVDGFDEVAKLDRSASDDLIGKIAAAEPARVILASRSSEWDSARYDQLIAEFLGSKPTIVRLQAFDEGEQRQLFGHLYPNERFDDFKQAATEFGIHVLLGNPQMLQIFGLAYVANGQVFESRAQIFTDAVEQMCREYNHDIPAIDRVSSKRIAAIGAEIFAKLLLSGATGIAASELAADRDFPFQGAVVDHDHAVVRQAIDTKLFKPSDGPIIHEPVHRIIAEFSAAKYLADRINDRKDHITLPRILAIMAPGGALREDLRGLLAWLTTAVTQDAQRICIDVNPYAVLANGDPSQLASTSKIYLIGQLAQLSASDPYFRRSDRWRKFNTKGFFTSEVVEALGQLLRTADGESDLRDLLLELVAYSGEAPALEPELRSIAFSSEPEFNTRFIAIEALAGIDERNRADDISFLIAEGSYNSLRLAAEIVADATASIPNGRVLELLTAFRPLFKNDDMALEPPPPSTYFISQLVSVFTASQVRFFLCELSRGLACICGKERSYECHCRVGISKLIGLLLDRYFEVAQGPHCPRQLWEWMKALNFRNDRSIRDSTSVKALQENDPLRRAMHLLAIENLNDEEDIWEAFIKFRHGEMHSGLFLTGDDQACMLQYAAKARNAGLFAVCYQTHGWHSTQHGPSAVRALQKVLARSDPTLLRIAVSKERRARKAMQYGRLPRLRSRAKWRKRRERVHRSNADHFAQNRSVIAKGEHWSWLKDFASEYLRENYSDDGVLQYVDDPAFIETALQSSVSFLSRHVPPLSEIGKLRAEGKYSQIPQVAYAAALAVFRQRGSLDDVGRSVLAAAKTDINASHSGLTNNEREAFHAEIDRRLFPTDKDLADYLADYVEPQLASDSITHTSASLLSYDSAFAGIADETALRWLREFPDMPLSSADTLIDVASKYERYDDLRAIIAERCLKIHERWPYGPPDKSLKEAQEFWFLKSFVFCGSEIEWEVYRQSPQSIFALSHRYDRFSSSRDSKWPALDARKIYMVLNAFVDVWPAVYLPSSWGTGSPKGETAFRFLNDLVWRIPDDEPVNQIDALEKLLSDVRFEKWHSACSHLLAEGRRKYALRNYAAPTPQSVNQLLDLSRVATVEDLRALVVEELRAAERWLQHGETDPLDAFYVNGKHVAENTARNRIVDRLNAQLQQFDVVLTIEAPMAQQNRCDFVAVTSIEGRRSSLVVEVKGQWHAELFEAATTQLHDRYAHHPDAANQGIYLVLWFGSATKVANKTTSGIQSASQLEAAIRDKLPPNIVGAVDVVALDLSR